MTRKEEIEQTSQTHYTIRPFASYKEGFKDGAEWADSTMIDKACEWLEPVFKNYAGYNCGMDLLNDFRKAME